VSDRSQQSCYWADTYGDEVLGTVLRSAASRSGNEIGIQWFALGNYIEAGGHRLSAREMRCILNFITTMNPESII
jgi:hypothetical protein